MLEMWGGPPNEGLSREFLDGGAMAAIASYKTARHDELKKLHLSPVEECNVDQIAFPKKLRTRKQMYEAILRVTKLDHLCEHEFSD